MKIDVISFIAPVALPAMSARPAFRSNNPDSRENCDITLVEGGFFRVSRAGKVVMVPRENVAYFHPSESAPSKK